jgi:ribosomal protein S3AE
MAIAKRKKRFFDVEMPIIGKQTQLQAYSIEELDGKYIKYDLTKTMRGKGMLLQLKVKVIDEKAIASPRQTQLLSFFLKRMVRKGTNYVEDSFSTNCKDAQIRIKPFLVTRRKVSRAVRKALREKAKEELIKYCEKQNSESLFADLLNNKIQKELSLKLKKIYPLSLCEIRVLRVEKELEKTEKPKKSDSDEPKEAVEPKKEETKPKEEKKE